MATSLLALRDLIDFKLERFRLENFVYKDELHLLRKLIELENKHPPNTQSRQTEPTQTVTIHQEQTSSELSSGRKISQRRLFKQKSAQVPDVELSELKLADKQNSHHKFEDDDFRDFIFGFDHGSTTTITSVSGSTDGDSVSDSSNHKEFRNQVLEWFQQLHRQTKGFKSEDESKRVRDIGNSTYRKERNGLKACDYFTEALFRAPVDSIAAAMAHANRSTVLHDCGMYEQAYDDCLCALDLGYPEEYHPIIKLRQASCALKMRKFNCCEVHLHELLHMELTESFQTRTYDIWHECEQLKSEKTEIGVQTDDELPWNGTKIYEVTWHDSNNVRTTNKGASIHATVDIAENTSIFKEDAAVFVSTGESRICDNCGITQFVCFPCLLCSNRTAVYCSRKCRTKHANIHALECFAHQIELFEEFATVCTLPRIVQLALRMLITGLPQVMPHCRKKPTVNKLWAAINGILTEREDIEYSILLRLESYVDKTDVKGIVTLAIIAHIIVIYLIECTDFFEKIQLTMPVAQRLAQSEWELLASALLLRHLFQLQHKNLVHCQSFALPTDPHILSPVNEFVAWRSYKRLRRGHLHLIAGNVTSIAMAIYPRTLCLCRHSCDAALCLKFSGRCMIAYATHEIATGSNIYNCFSSYNYQQSLQRSRKEELSHRGIDCKCEKCISPDPDEDFHKFHRYRCDNPNCRQIFTPSNVKRTSNFRWWENDYEHILRKYVSYAMSSFDDDDGAVNSGIINCNDNNLISDNSLINNKSNASKCYSDDHMAGIHKHRNDNMNRQYSKGSNSTTMKWKRNPIGDSMAEEADTILTCSVCQTHQKLEWFWTFRATLLNCDSIEDRCKLYSAIDRAETHLVDMHECKAVLARELVEQCLYLHRDGIDQLDEWEFNKLGSLMRSALPVISAQYRTNSIEYVQHMTYFWDVMALSNYKCTDRELMQMLNAIDYIPDEYKEIFINYYEDYIAPKYVEESYLENGHVNSKG